MPPSLIVMLTKGDVTVSNARTIFESCADLPVGFWGFKDVGLATDEMKRTVETMQRNRKTTFLEVVSLTEDAAIRAAETAVECKFDYLMGTVFSEKVLEYAHKIGLKYLPFCGRVSGHPSVLIGDPRDILADALRLQLVGVDGLDLLAYRNAAAGERIAKEVVDGLQIPIVIAGSIDSFNRLDTMIRIQPWAFTIGSALFDGRFGGDLDFRSQVLNVIEYLRKFEAVDQKRSV